MKYSNNKPYYTYDQYLKDTFGGKTIKIPLDGGFTCPNIDGTKGRGGCTYCTKECLPYRGKPLAEQFESAKAPLLKKWGREGVKERYIPYFQTFSGTYAPVERLRALYEEALALPHTVGLSIATRCDCLSDEVVALLRELAQRTFLTVELGLQTIHEDTALRIGRGHTYEEFLDVAENKPGFIKAMWCGDVECEEALKEETGGVKSRCIPFVEENLSGVCVCCGKPAKHMVVWGRQY
jgi:radical SAM protein (TIGR01212 family)